MVEFQELACSFIEKMVDTIVIDGVVHPFEQRDDLLSLLEEHICNHIIKVGKGYYKQKSGIPQGSVVSSLLCGVYYGKFETEFLGRVSSNPMNLMIRYIDDFLLVTPNMDDAIEFMKLLHNGIPKFGIEIRHSKSLTNFDCLINGSQIENISHTSLYFPWCGLLLNLDNLDVYADYSRYEETKMVNSISVDITNKPGLLLKNKMMQEVKNRSHPIFVASGFNTSHATFTNVYQSLVLCAKRLSVYLKHAFERINEKFVANLITDIVSYQYSLLASQTRAKLISKSESEWLFLLNRIGYSAFINVLTRNHQQYRETLQILNEKRNKVRGHAKKFQQIIKQKSNLAIMKFR